MHDRIDNRTVAEFKKDIKRDSCIELDIVIRMCCSIYDQTGVLPEIIPNGTDYTGKFTKYATTDPDFVISSLYTEITHSKYHVKEYFHEKQKKIEDLIKKNHTLVFVDGYLTRDPKYIWLTANTLKKATDYSIKKHGLCTNLGTKKGVVNKPFYRYNVSWFKKEWCELPRIIKVPDEYKHLIC